MLRHFHEADAPVGGPTVTALNRAVSVLGDLGAEIREVTVSPLQDYAAPGWLIMLTEAYAVHKPWLTSDYNKYGALLREKLAIGGLLSGADYVQALRRRRLLCAEMVDAMAELDMVVTAVQPGEAPPIGEAPRWGILERPSYTMPFNVTGQPAISVCTGFGPGGLPLGMQIGGKPFAEPVLFRTAHAFETATVWRQTRPQPGTVS